MNVDIINDIIVANVFLAHLLWYWKYLDGKSKKLKSLVYYFECVCEKNMNAIMKQPFSLQGGIGISLIALTT